jgi:hypothetical protein
VTRSAVVLAALAAAALCGGARAETVWLCHPSQASSPCTAELGFTSVLADGSARAYAVGARRGQPVDCFYVYPTVSRDAGGNSDLRAGIEERDVARSQASWFSPICRVFAPLYRQVTATAGASSKPGLAYADVRAAWREYLARDNAGRGVVLIGHSQGTFLLRRLIAEELDGDPERRRLLVSALLLGGNVVVGTRRAGDGDFAHVPPCRSMRQLGCVVAFSAWQGPPPANAAFQRVGDAARQRVLCINPAAPGGGAAPVTPLFLTTSFEEMGGVTPRLMLAVDTDWVSYPGQYRARCVRRGATAWLEVKAVTRGDARPAAKPTRGAAWGLHDLDVNIALTELVALVASQAAAYEARK